MVKASHTSSLVQGRAWKLIIPTDPPTPLPTPTPPPATQWTHRAQGCCFQGKNTSERKRESLFLGGEGLTTHCRKTFDNVLSHLSFICSKAETA